MVWGYSPLLWGSQSSGVVRELSSSHLKSGNREGGCWCCAHFLWSPSVQDPSPWMSTMGGSQVPNTGTDKARNLQMLSWAWRQKPDRCLRIREVKRQDLSGWLWPWGDGRSLQMLRCCALMLDPGQDAHTQVHQKAPPDGQQSSGLTRVSSGCLGSKFLLKGFLYPEGLGLEHWTMRQRWGCYFSSCSYWKSDCFILWSQQKN